MTIEFSSPDGPNGWLDPRAAIPVRDREGEIWSCAESLFQASRFLGHPDVRERLRAAQNPADIRRVAVEEGSRLPSREREIHRVHELAWEAVLALCEQHPAIRERLLETEGLISDARAGEEATWLGFEYPTYLAHMRERDAQLFATAWTDLRAAYRFRAVVHAVLGDRDSWPVLSRSPHASREYDSGGEISVVLDASGPAYQLTLWVRHAVVGNMPEERCEVPQDHPDAGRKLRDWLDRIEANTVRPELARRDRQKELYERMVGELKAELVAIGCGGSAVGLSVWFAPPSDLDVTLLDETDYVEFSEDDELAQATFDVSTLDGVESAAKWVREECREHAARLARQENMQAELEEFLWSQLAEAAEQMGEGWIELRVWLSTGDDYRVMLQARLDEAKKKSQRVILAAHVIHHANQHPDVGWYIKYKPIQEAFGKLLAANKHIVAFFAGHAHCGMRGWDDTAHGIHEVILPCVSYNTDRKLDMAPGFAVSEFRPAWTRVDVFPTKLVLNIKPVGAEVAATIEFRSSSEAKIFPVRRSRTLT